MDESGSVFGFRPPYPNRLGNGLLIVQAYRTSIVCIVWTVSDVIKKLRFSARSNRRPSITSPSFRAPFNRLFVVRSLEDRRQGQHMPRRSGAAPGSATPTAPSSRHPGQVSGTGEPVNGFRLGGAKLRSSGQLEHLSHATHGASDEPPPARHGPK
jgi:hypothetical protein